MNSAISLLFRAIPLSMAVFCFVFGAFIFQHGGGGSRIMAGLVVFVSGVVCIALFCNTEIIIRQIKHSYGRNIKYILLTISYFTALITVISGIYIFIRSSTSSAFVTGHTLVGMGFVTVCLAIVTTASTRLNLLFSNSESSGNKIPEGTFSLSQERVLEAVVSTISLVAWIWAFLLMIYSHVHPVYFVAGHIMAGIACICTSLIAVVATIVRQTRNVYTEKERARWLELALMMGTISTVWGIYIAFGNVSVTSGISGFIMIGLGLVCYSIIGKIVVLDRLWKNHFKLVNFILLIPILASIVCFLLSVFVFEYSAIYADYIIPARILTSLGCICFAFIPTISLLSNKLFLSE